MSITLSLVAVFVPLIFMGGLLGRLLHERTIPAPPFAELPITGKITSTNTVKISSTTSHPTAMCPSLVFNKL